MSRRQRQYAESPAYCHTSFAIQLTTVPAVVSSSRYAFSVRSSSAVRVVASTRCPHAGWRGCRARFAHGIGRGVDDLAGIRSEHRAREAAETGPVLFQLGLPN